jgi:hypothetical protein
VAIGTLVTRTGVAYAGKFRAPALDTGAYTGTFLYGELITQATSNATARIAYIGTTKLWLRDITGTFNDSAVVTGGTSNATATASALVSTQWTDAWVTLGRLRDTISVTRNREVTTITDFDTPEDSFTDQIVGNQTANMTGVMNVEPSGTTFQLFEAAMDGNFDFALRRVLTDRAGTGVRTRYYLGQVSQFDEQDSVTDASTVSFGLALNSSTIADPTA